MRILVVGGGGREHTIAWKLKQSPKVEKIYCAPGNGGISAIAECVDMKPMEFDKLIDFVKNNAIDLTVVAPDDPLVAGAVDEFEKAGLRVFGPRANAAVIEGSKVFAKGLMKKHNIPTARYEVFDDSAEAIAYVTEQNRYPTVIKADGLALGKGVIIANNEEEAREAVISIMDNKVFGGAGGRVVIEEFLTGREVSVLAFTDGKTVSPMVSAQDHKRALDNDMGLNTGGMGTFAPSDIYTDDVARECMEKIFMPTMEAMNSEGRMFKGVLYFGLIKTDSGMKVIEYNCRFGDPETQVVLPLLKTDLVDVINAVIDGELDKLSIEWEDLATVCVVMSSGGYPQKYDTGFKISGIDDAEKSGALVFHAGTKADDSGYYTSGGRVLGVVAIGDDLKDARNKSYDAVKKISFQNMHYRKDIAQA